MPLAQISNPFGVNSYSVNGNIGNEQYLSSFIMTVAGDPVGSIPAATTISSISAATAAVVTTSAAHGLISGMRVTLAGIVLATGTGTAPNGDYTVTATGATTFTIPVVTTGQTFTLTSATIRAPFGVGQSVQWQSFNGSQSGAASAPYYPTVALSSTTANALGVGVVIGGTTLSGPPVIGGPLQVMIEGICVAFLDASTTLGQNLIASTTHPGQLRGGTGTTTANFGTMIAPSYTLAGQGSLQWAYIHSS